MYGEVKNSHDVTEHKHNSMKVNVWCTVMKNKVVSPFFLEVSMVTGDTFLTTENNALHHASMGSLPTKWCTISFLASRSCLSGHEVS